MLTRYDESAGNTYGFDFKNITRIDSIATVRSIGIETRNTKDNYFWDCSSRIDTETFIFQYTLSGCGEIKIDGKIYSLPKGYAFVVAVPEDSQYYLPASSDDWKFIFITLSGEEVKNCWKYINTDHGHVFEISQKKRIIQQLISTYIDVQNSQLLDVYQASHKAYEFLTYCYRHFETRVDSEVIKMPPDVERAILFIKENFTEPLSIDDISESTGLSKYHLSRKFKSVTSYSLLNYLNKYRIEQAIYLLQHTSKTIKEISADVGFIDPNYFCKVFRKTTGISPNSTRKTKVAQQDLDFLITDQHGIIDLD